MTPVTTKTRRRYSKNMQNPIYQEKSYSPVITERHKKSPTIMDLHILPDWETKSYRGKTLNQPSDFPVFKYIFGDSSCGIYC
jgi:hypothetical protein